MNPGKQRHDPVRLFGRRLLLLLVVGVLVMSALGVWRTFWKEREAAQLDVQAKAHLSDLADREMALTNNIAILQTARGKEAALRQEYKVGAPGEKMIVIVTPDTPAPTSTSPSFIDNIVHAMTSWW